jgi:hypothetical protein
MLREVTCDFSEPYELVGRISNRGNRHAGPESGTIFSNSPTFILYPAIFHSQLQEPLRPASADLCRWVKGGKVLPNDFGGFVSFCPFSSRIPCHDPPFRVQHENCIVLHAVNEQSKRLVPLVPRYLGQNEPFFPQASTAAIIIFPDTGSTDDSCRTANRRSGDVEDPVVFNLSLRVYA